MLLMLLMTIIFPLSSIPTETPQAIKDSKSIRRSSLENGIPYYTTVSGAVAAVAGIKSIKEDEMDVIPIQLYKK